MPEKKINGSPVFATSVAAGVESFYRSALNAFINSALLGQKVQKLFPDMHVQAPVRMMYINGIKQSRVWLANNIEPEKYGSMATAVRTAVWCGPGVVMTPISSILEAANAGNKNPEPLLTKRWLRGITARCVREIIFAVGVNQLSEYIEECVPEEKVSSPLLRNSIGSLTAGVMSGYFSHVPHNMSALKLHYPDKSYWELFVDYAKSSEARLPSSIADPVQKQRMGWLLALVAPKALVARTTQIVGTFVLLNGIIFMLKDVQPTKVLGWDDEKPKAA
eukprot:TRINITY_DN12662_c0_g1_i1.p1 TRINITY_DN12662_c0_g1~~TRINITY_DN12662_c0_g1_i1.p1  ORF type:complete len:277 (+),score=90.17 TRINITY_DN12662_c0_g1_i1:61-891(+)